jgi:catechol 2,3-dioxygenase-like lactoylglutathione lyase family enzyme
MKVLFVSGFGPIVEDGKRSRELYADTLGLDFEEAEGGYLHTEKLDGVKHFALWPLSQAAESCFGKSTWPENLPIPRAWLEFDVEDLQAATKELEERGYKLLVAARREPWGQTVTRFLTPERLLLGVVLTPSMRKEPK